MVGEYVLVETQTNRVTEQKKQFKYYIDTLQKNIKNSSNAESLLKELKNKLDKISENLEKSNIMEITYILGNKKEILKRNLIAGIARGVGIGIGVTLITAILIYILQKIILLNIPIIGDYITDIVQIVEKNSGRV